MAEYKQLSNKNVHITKVPKFRKVRAERFELIVQKAENAYSQ